MLYQHPEGEIIRDALNARHISRPTVPGDNQATFASSARNNELLETIED